VVYTGISQYVEYSRFLWLYYARSFLGPRSYIGQHPTNHPISALDKPLLQSTHQAPRQLFQGLAASSAIPTDTRDLGYRTCAVEDEAYASGGEGDGECGEWNGMDWLGWCREGGECGCG